MLTISENMLGTLLFTASRNRYFI